MDYLKKNKVLVAFVAAIVAAVALNYLNIL
jgi:hypothetical protein